MRWMIAEDKLGPDQREVINDLSKNWQNTWIKGHAGSGKSVLLIHLIRDYLIKHPGSKVCVVVFTRALVDMLQVGIKELGLEKLFNVSIPVITIYKFKDAETDYDVVFCDEVQDLPVSFLEILMSRANQVIVAGDEAQSIYELVPNFDERPAFPEEILSNLNAQPKPLHYIYRLTKSVVSMLSKVFTSLLSGKSNIERNDVEIKFFKASTLQKEIDYVWKEATKVNSLRADEIVAILIPHGDSIVDFANRALQLSNAPAWTCEHNGYNKINFGKLNSHLYNHKVPLMYVGSGYGSLESADVNNRIIVMTYHSAKGLDFDHVFLPMLGTPIHLASDKADTLLFVALSRSKYNLMISYAGNLYSPMQKFMTGRVPVSIDELIKPYSSERIII